MISNTFPERLSLPRIFWFGVIGLASVITGYAVAADTMMLFLATCWLVWLATLPYHATISIGVAVATFTSAFIVPYFPGRPYFWEFAALLGWSGLLVTVSMRQYRAEFMQLIRQNRWLFIGAVGYCAVLLVIMYYRGFGLRIFGGEQMGGRFYFQQLSCSVFPLLFAMCKVSERRLVGLFLLQCGLSFTYLISDFAFSIAPHRLFPLLQFFELPADAINFERSAENFGIRRVQSLMVLAQGSFFILLIIRNLRDFFSVKGIWLIPVSLIILTVGTLSGHRWFSLLVGLTLLFSAYGQRFFDARNTLICLGVSGLILLLTYAFADRLPLASQRALSFLPGIRIEEQARGDASATLETRLFLRKIGWSLVPSYVWIGRGFGQSGYGDYSSQWDPTLLELHLNQGKFYNGIIGLLVNTGVPGTVFMLLFLSAGTVLALKIMRFLRTHGCDDNFERLCTVLAGLWMANVIAFLFLHGDSEYAMKTFSLQSGLLLACHRCLTERLKQQDVAASV